MIYSDFQKRISVLSSTLCPLGFVEVSLFDCDCFIVGFSIRGVIPSSVVKILYNLDGLAYHIESRFDEPFIVIYVDKD